MGRTGSKLGFLKNTILIEGETFKSDSTKIQTQKLVILKIKVCFPGCTINILQYLDLKVSPSIILFLILFLYIHIYIYICIQGMDDSITMNLK